MSGIKWSSLAQSCAKCLILLFILQSSQILGEDADNLDLGYKWIRQNVQGRAPANAVIGGIDGHSIVFVGRAYHNGDLLPAKVIPAKQKASVSYNGKEYPKYDVEILVQTRPWFEWKFTNNGYVYPNAVVGGYTSSGETLYIGRVDYDRKTTVGKIQPSQRCLYIPYNGTEISFSKYDVLTHD